MKSLSSSLIYILAASLFLTACGNDKKTVGPSGPPPAAPAEKRVEKGEDDQTTPPDEDVHGGPSGGLKKGPEEADSNGTPKNPKRPQGGDIPLENGDDQDDKNADRDQDDRPSAKAVKPKPADIDRDGDDEREIHVREITLTQRQSEELFEKKPRQKPIIQEKSAPAEKKSVFPVTQKSAKLPVAKTRGDLPVLGDTLPVRGQTKPAPVADFEAPEYDKSPAYAWMYHTLNPFVKLLGKGEPAPKALPNKMRIMFAIGYFDGYHDKPLIYRDENYGRHANVDPWLRIAVDKIITRSCAGQGNSQLCGFELESTNGMESVYTREGYDSTIQEIHLVSAGETTSYDENSTSSTQGEASRQAARLFAQSFDNSDLVIYVGHSRAGGGPDFFMPRLNNAGHVDYDSYLRRREGERMVVEALRKPSRRARALALMSCDSSDHFLGSIRRNAPDMQVATINGVIGQEYQLNGGLAALDLYLRRGSLHGLNSFGSISATLGGALEVRNPL